jgi:hypothetical protein
MLYAQYKIRGFHQINENGQFGPVKVVPILIAYVHSRCSAKVIFLAIYKYHTLSKTLR